MKTIISSYQTTLILIVIIVSTSIIFLPSLLTEYAGQDAWITGLFLIIFGLILSLIYSPLCKRMERVDLINFNRKVMGNILTFPVGMILILVFTYIGGTVVRETAEVMASAYLTQTPLRYIVISIIFTATIIVAYGLEVMARTLEIFFYLFLISFLFFVFLLVKDVSFSFLKPVLADGIGPVLMSTYPGIIFFSEIFIILILSPQITDRGNQLKPLFTAIIIGGILLQIVILITLLIFGPELVKNLNFPLVTANSYIKAFMILERLDPLFIFYWVGGGVFKTAIFLYVIVYIAQKLTGTRSYRIFIPLALPGIFYFSFYFYKNIIKISETFTEIAPFAAIILIIYPLILLLLSYIRGVNFNEKG